MKNKSFGSRIIAYPYIVWSAIFIIVPLIIMFYFAEDKHLGVSD